jgi:hypothetical protein
MSRHPTIAGLASAALALAPVAACAGGPPIQLTIGEGAVRPLAAAAVIRIDGGFSGPDYDVVRIYRDVARKGGDDMTCLTQAVYYEARSESLAGQQAVAQVVMNRTHDRQYPASVCGTVFQRTGAYATCQFSFACDGAMGRPIEPVAWERAKDVAAKALGGFTYEPMREATHFHAAWMTPYWSANLIRVRQIGGHVFYR